MPQSKYHKAEWLGDGVSGGKYETGPYRIVLHTTETPGMPGYSDGRSAPHLTYDPKARTWVQHTSLLTAARALRNESGGVQTNRERALQVEIICYSDKRIADQKDYRLWVGDLSDDALADLRAFVIWAKAAFGVKPYWPGVQALNYRQANAVGFRMGDQEWELFSGVCGHQHVPENVHWDPGALDWTKVMSFETQEAAPMPLKPYEEAAIADLIDEGIFTTYTVDEEGEVDAEVKLRTLAVFLHRVSNQIDELERKVAALEARPIGGAGKDGVDGTVTITVNGKVVC